MLEMNPYYAHCSPVGQVFDVATFSPSKAVTTIVIGVVKESVESIWSKLQDAMNMVSAQLDEDPTRFS